MDCRVKPGNDGCLEDHATRFPICAKSERLSPSGSCLFGAAEFRPGAPGWRGFLLRIEDIDATRCRPEFEAAIYEDLAGWNLLGNAGAAAIGAFCALSGGGRRIGGPGPDLSELREPRGDRPSGRATRGRRAVAARSRRRAALSGRREIATAGRARAADRAGRALRASARHAGRARTYRGTELERRGRGSGWRERRRRCTARGLGRRHPGAQGDADELSFVRRDRRRPAGRYRRGAGRDLFWSTSVHLLLQQLLGIPQPVYRHHRLIEDLSGHKLSKSTQATALRELRGQGVTPAGIRSLVGLPDDFRSTTGGC